MKKQLFALLLSLSACPSFAQLAPTDALYKTILSRDSLLFDIGFNHCNVQQMEALLSDKLHFYHDKGGVSGKARFMSDFKSGLCKDPAARQVIRTLVKGSTQVFPLYNKGKLYGAVQNGEHMFYESPQSQPGIARFTSVWELENGNWKLSHSISFYHQAYTAPQTANAVLDNDSAIGQWLRENNIPVLGLGIIDQGKLQQIKVFGHLSEGTTAPYNTIFNVASLTKPVTAMVALKLVSQGKWDLDEPLYTYWTDPDIATDARRKRLTTRLILSHQTGFANWRRMSTDNKLRFEFDPGTKYQYSGEGMEYLRKALERKFKKSLQQLADELVFQPLHLSDTRYVWDKNLDSSRLADGYDQNGMPYIPIKHTRPNAADDLLTTVGDYGTFLASVLHGEGLSPKVFEAMHTPQVASTRGKHFGLGFEIYNMDDGAYVLSHGGADDGVQTIVFMIPATGQGLLIFTNSDVGTRIYEPLIRKYLGRYGEQIIDIETK